MEQHSRIHLVGLGVVLVASLAVMVAAYLLLRQPEESTGLSPSNPGQTDVLEGEAEAGRPQPEAEDDQPEPLALSVGSTQRGKLLHAKGLPLAGPGFEILGSFVARDFRWGTEELIALVEHVGARLAKDKRTLFVDNLSAQMGGPISHSVSHQSGRDVDLAFCYMDDQGRPATPPEFMNVDAAGEVKHLSLRLDEACTWSIIEALLTWPVADVQHVFVAPYVKQLLMAHAEASGVSPEMRKRAALLMSRGTRAERHGDHLHVRIPCPQRPERLCADAAAGMPSGKSPRILKLLEKAQPE